MNKKSVLSSDLIQMVVQKIVCEFDPEQIVLFGSYAKGNQTKASDLDLLIVKNTQESPYKRSLNIRKMFRDLAVPLDILVYTQDEINSWRNEPFAFVTKILKQGKTLWKKRENVLF